MNEALALLETPRLSRTLQLSIALLIAVVAVGTLGYVAIEGWSWFDAFYMTITTITTIGGGEPQPMSVGGRWWTIAVVAIGFGVLTYTLLQLLSFTLEGRLSSAVAQRQHRRRVMKMDGHFILCGFGRVGSEIARIFTREGHDFVIIDINPKSLQRAAAEGYTTVEGDAAEASTLEAAGVGRAAGLIAAVDTDETNIYVTLSARVLNPNLFIVARANRRDAESKLRLAGASRIISPYAIGGSRMASLAMRPTAVEFVDTVLFGDNSELVLEDFQIVANFVVAGTQRRRSHRRVEHRHRFGRQARRVHAVSSLTANAVSRRRRNRRRRSARWHPFRRRKTPRTLA